jgi:hypothetical protein
MKVWFCWIVDVFVVVGHLHYYCGVITKAHLLDNDEPIKHKIKNFSRRITIFFIMNVNMTEIVKNPIPAR